MIHIEGLAEDYMGWGFDAWDYEAHVKRILRGTRLPPEEIVATATSAATAHVPVGLRVPYTPPLQLDAFPAARAFVDTASASMRTVAHAFNPPSGHADEQAGVGPFAATRCGGARADAFHAHIATLDPVKFACRFHSLSPAVPSPAPSYMPRVGTNLTVITDAYAEKIDLAMPRPVGARVAFPSDGVPIAAAVAGAAGGAASGGAGGAGPSSTVEGKGVVADSSSSTNRSLAVAVGVQLSSGVYVPLDPDGEVIVCAGAFQTPQLLMLSGIGDPAALQRVRVPTYVASPFVGANLQDHLDVSLNFAVRNLPTNAISVGGLSTMARDTMHWIRAGKKLMASPERGDAGAAQQGGEGAGGVAARGDALDDARTRLCTSGVVMAGAFVDVAPGGRVTGPGALGANEVPHDSLTDGDHSTSPTAAGASGDGGSNQASPPPPRRVHVFDSDHDAFDPTGGDRLSAEERAAAMANGPAGLERRVQMHFLAIPTKKHMHNLLFGDGVSMHVCQLQPRSVGYVALQSADPTAAPVINPRYLTDEAGFDLEVMTDAVQMGHTLAHEGPLGRHVKRAFDPHLNRARTRDDYRNVVRRLAETIYHPVGTCAMGPLDRGGVVEAGTLRCHGVANVRVADASVMPRVITGNTNIPCQIIGHRAAEMIAGRPL